MTQSTTLSEVRTSPRTDVVMGFGNLQSFELIQRVAKMLSSSTLVPTAYRAVKEVKEYGKVVGYEDNPAALPNCIVALNMAQRMGADPLMIMQNLHIIEGRPSWSSAFIIASINSCGRYSSLRFEISKPGEPVDVEYTAVVWLKPKNGGKKEPTEVKKIITVRHQTCKAWAIEKETGERLESPAVSIQMAIDEGWLTKNGSKWQTIPELMLRYRCASFFGRLYAPELLMGLQTVEEAQDIIEAEPMVDNTIRVNADQLRAGVDGSGNSATGSDAGRHPEATDADFKELDASPREAKAEAGKPAQGAASAAPASTGDPLPIYADVAKALRDAKTLDSLDLAADLIRDVEDDNERGDLEHIYGQRRTEIETPATKPTRRAANVSME